MFKTTIASCGLHLPSVFCYLSSVLCRLFSTTVERALQIHLFLTNKANFRKVKLDASDYITMNYAKWTLGERGKNKANSKPIQTQYKAKTKPKQTQYKQKQSQFRKGATAH